MKCIESTSFTSGAILAFVLLGNASFSSCFSSNAFSKKNEAARSVFQWFSESPRMTKSIETQLNASTESQTAGSSEIARDAFVKRGLASIAALGGLALGTPAPAVADEYGRETEMDFLTTGETVEICIKRGPLGKCEKTEKRTAENENDKSEKYFQKPTVVIKQKEEPDENEGNDLIARLKQRSEENAEKNEQLVYQRTLMNDAVSVFFRNYILLLFLGTHPISCRVCFQCVLGGKLWSF